MAARLAATATFVALCGALYALNRRAHNLSLKQQVADRFDAWENKAPGTLAAFREHYRHSEWSVPAK